MIDEVRVARVEPQWIASVRRQTNQDQFSIVIPEACGEVWQFLRATGTPHSGLNLVVYLDWTGNLECGVIVPERFDSDGPVICSATPGGTVATTSHQGPYDRLGETHEAIMDWCVRRGHTLVGPCWEIYGHWNDDPAKLRTDVVYLLKEEP